MFKKLVLILLILLFAAIIYEKWIISEEARIRKVLDRGTRAFEEGDLAACLACVSLGYHDEWGLNYFQVKALLARVMEEFRNFEISMEEVQVRVDKKGATAFLKVRVLARYRGRRGYLVGSGDGAVPVQIELIKERLRWKVTTVNGVRTSGFNEDLSRSI